MSAADDDFDDLHDVTLATDVCPRCEGLGRNEDGWDYIECSMCLGLGEIDSAH